MDILIYYLKANILIAIFVLLYISMFRKETHFQLNRYFLLLGMVSALLIPTITISTQTIHSVQIPVNQFIFSELIDESVALMNSPGIIEQNNHLTFFSVLKIVYFIGVILFGLRFIFFIVKLLSLVKKGVLRQIGNTFFVATNQGVQPFSFFNFVFYYSEKVSDAEFDTIMAHENAHVKQLHTFDLLITEVLLIVFWFNPFVFLLRNAVRANHEFLADAAVLNGGVNKEEYMQTLAVQTSSHIFGDFGSHFKSSTLKKRIVMITKKRSSFIKNLKYLSVLPLIAILFLSFASKEISKSVISAMEMPNLNTEYLEKGKKIDLPDETQMNFIGESSIHRVSENKIIISNVTEMISSNIKFYGDKFEYDAETKTITALGDSCFMEIIDESSFFKFNFSEINLNKFKFIYPFKNKEKARISSGYGTRIHPISKEKKMHNGVDFAADEGTPVLSIAKGKVRKVYENPKNYGKFIIIDHPDGFSSLYAQLLNYNVKIGDEVEQGDIIGFVGSSGMSTGKHLHLELKKDGKYVNPIEYIEKD